MDRHEPQLYGFWIRVHDRESALYAVRMSGLAGILQALVVVFDPTLLGGERIFVLILAGLLVCAGIAIRRGAVLIVPAVCIFMLLSLLAGLAMLALEVFRHFRLGDPDRYLLLSFTWQSVIPLLLLMMMISGLRGWWWLRRDRKTEAVG